MATMQHSRENERWIDIRLLHVQAVRRQAVRRWTLLSKFHDLLLANFETSVKTMYCFQFA